MRFLVAIAIICFSLSGFASANAQASARKPIDIPAQELGAALQMLAKERGFQVVYVEKEVAGLRTAGVKGELTAEEALTRILQGTGLTFQSFASDEVSILPIASAEAFPRAHNSSTAGPARLVQANAPSSQESNGYRTQAAEESKKYSAGSGSKGIPEILVKGSRSQNVDIERTEDGALPYVVLTGEDIKKSNATSLDDFLRTRLPMNTQNISGGQFRFGEFSNSSRGLINLRGLGTNQTLVLVDGRRLPGIGEFNIEQSNIAGIPLAAIERIEVLPSTAGAIYGGSAVGGVVNVILKRNYSGIDMQLDYGNTFDRATGDVKASIAGGFDIGSAKVMVTASRNHMADLNRVDRNELFLRSRELTLRNNRTGFLNGFNPLGGYTPNICGTTNGYSCDGTDLVLDDGTPLNASVTYVPRGYAGAAGDGGIRLMENAGQYNLDVSSAPGSLLEESTADATGLNVRLPAGRRFDVFLDVNADRKHGEFARPYSHDTTLDAGDINNPFQQTIMVRYSPPDASAVGKNSVTNIRLNGGVIIRLTDAWSLSIEHGWSRSRSRYENDGNVLTQAGREYANQFITQDINVFRPDFSSFRYPLPSALNGPNVATLIDSVARSSGPVFKLPGGSLMLSALAERRQERVGDYFQEVYFEGMEDFGITPISMLPARRQTVESLYLEGRAPLVSNGNALFLLRELELQASVRYDHYKTVGTLGFINANTREEAQAAKADAVYATNTMGSTGKLIGLRYSPIEGLALRASWSTGFLPPSLSQVQSITSVFPAAFTSLTDPRREGQSLIGDVNGNIAQTGGGNPDLDPETSTSVAVGIILKPTFIDGLRISADYMRIRKSGEITMLSAQSIIDNEGDYPGRVTRGPNRPGDPVGFAGPIVSYDSSLINAFRSEIDSVDLQTDYDLQTALGDFHLYSVVSRQQHLKRQITQTLGLIEQVGFNDGPLLWRGNAGVDWRKDNIRIGWNTQYYDSYLGFSAQAAISTRDEFVLNQGTARIPSQSYHDVSAGYRFADTGLLSGTEVSAGIQNVFGKKPPVITSTVGTYSTFGDPRLRRYTLTFVKNFGKR